MPNLLDYPFWILYTLLKVQHDTRHNAKERGMAYRRGHVTGEKREKQGASDWFRAIDEANIQRIEAEWREKHQQAQTAQQTAESVYTAHDLCTYGYLDCRKGAVLA